MPAISKRIAILDSDIAGQKGIDGGRYRQVKRLGKELAKNSGEDHFVSGLWGLVLLNLFKNRAAGSGSGAVGKRREKGL